MPRVNAGTTRVRVCSVDDLPLDEVQVVQVGDRRVAVFNTSEGVFAVDDQCTHQDAALSDGFLEGCLVECPLHASFFDLRTGVPTSPPATQPVATYPVVVDGDGIHLDVPVVPQP